MKNFDIENLWKQTVLLLETLSYAVPVSPHISKTIDRSQNEIFLLSGSLSFYTTDDDITICMDLYKQIFDKNPPDLLEVPYLRLKADIGKDTGEIIAIGPQVRMELDIHPEDFDTVTAAWLADFEQFLSDNQQIVIEHVNKMA